MKGRLVALWLAFALPASGTDARRPAVDVAAMHEAMRSSADDVVYPSAASYAHFLRARLAHHDGAPRTAIDELRLALASDERNPFLLTRLAEACARLSDYDQAEAHLKRVLARSPGYAPAQLLMGRVLMESGKPARARVHLARAIALEPAGVDAYLALAQLDYDAGRVDEAVRVVERLGAAVPGEAIGFRRLGLVLAERGDPRAQRLLREAVARDPGDVAAWRTLAELYESGGDLEKALEAFERGLQSDGDDVGLLLSAGRLALALERLPEARGWFDAAVARGADAQTAVAVALAWLSHGHLEAAARVLDDARGRFSEPRLQFYTGLVQERRQAWAQALAAFEAVPSDAGDLFVESQLHRARALSSLGRHAQALRVLAEVAAAQPDWPGLALARALAFERAGDAAAAERTLRRQLEADQSPEVLEAASAFFERQGRASEGTALIGQLLAARPGDEALRYAFAVALEREGAWERAVEAMKALLRQSPGQAAALNFIGYTLVTHGGDLAEAERHLTSALALRPDSPAILDSMGWLLLKKGDDARALEVLRRAQAQRPDDATLLEHLAWALTRVGDAGAAREALERALRLLDGAPEAAERRSQRDDLRRQLKMLTP